MVSEGMWKKWQNLKCELFELCFACVYVLGKKKEKLEVKLKLC